MTAAGKVLIVGADGFIGRHLAFSLRAAGWQVVAHARRVDRLQQMGFEVLQADLARPEAADPAFWRARLAGVSHVVNAAGLLTGSEARFRAVHVAAPKAILDAMPKGARGVLISAVGIDASETAFARFRREGEAVAHTHGLTILRPGLVLGDTSYGGSSLLRALSGLPFLMPVVGQGDQPFNPIHATDLAQVVDHLLQNPQPGNPVEIGGPEEITQAGMIRAYRAWMGLPPARMMRLPLPVAKVLGRVGDALRMGPISATSVAQLSAGVLAKPSPHDPAPRGFSEFLNARPAGTQDLWHARLYLLRPLLRLVLAVLWLASGLLGLFLPADSFLPLLGGALPDGLAVALARLGGIVDLVIGVALIRAWRLRLLAGMQGAMIAAYTLVFSALAPGLWLLPLGGLLKNLPLLVLIGLHAVLEDER